VPGLVVRGLNVADPVLGWRGILSIYTRYTCGHRKEDSEGKSHRRRECWEENWSVSA
jgi:hypothetical protein